MDIISFVSLIFSTFTTIANSLQYKLFGFQFSALDVILYFIIGNFFLWLFHNITYDSYQNGSVKREKRLKLSKKK